MLDTVFLVDTPEHVAFRLRVAGPARRAFAWALDGAVRFAILLTFAAVISIATASLSLPGLGHGLVLVAMFALNWVYFVASELVTGGRSPGKIWFKLRVVRTDGLPITWRESMIRNLLRAADVVIVPPVLWLVPVGAVVMAFDPRFRRLGDLAAGTMVVVEDSAAIANQTHVEPDPAVVARLPEPLPLDRAEVEAIELFVRRDRVSAARREELAEIVAGRLAARMGLEPPRDKSRFLASVWARLADPRSRGAKASLRRSA